MMAVKDETDAAVCLFATGLKKMVFIATCFLAEKSIKNVYMNLSEQSPGIIHSSHVYQYAPNTRF